MIVTQRSKWWLDFFTHLFKCRQCLANGTVLPISLQTEIRNWFWRIFIFFILILKLIVYLVHRFNYRWNDVGSFRFLERMSAQHFLANFRRWLTVFRHQINQRMSICTVQTISVFISRHCDLFYILAQFDSGLTVDLDQFVDTSQCWLTLTCH